MAPKTHLVGDAATFKEEASMSNYYSRCLKWRQKMEAA
jgi:hypothetical protein